MALDGCTLYLIRKELEDALLEGRVDKIYQPARDELVFQIKGPRGAHKLYLCANANCVRVGLTKAEISNPKTPPTFCMLLRKHLGSARLAAITQPGGMERMLLFVFETRNEMGDPIRLTLAAELMGRHSNLTLIGPDGRILDAVKRVDVTMSAARQILPGLQFVLPPAQEKHNLLKEPADQLAKQILQMGGWLDKACMAVLQGISPIVAREISEQTAASTQVQIGDLTNAQTDKLTQVLDHIINLLREGKGCPTMVMENNQPKDTAFIMISQYRPDAEILHADSFSELYESFYGQKSNGARTGQRAHDLQQWLDAAISRTAHKMELQRAELLQSESREQFRIYGDLISANLYRMKKGDHTLLADNFYADGEQMTVPLDPLLTPSQNMQQFYKKYKKAATAQKMLTEQMKKAAQELEYFESVADLLLRSTCEDEVTELREELRSQGYLRSRSKGQRAVPTKPNRYRSTDGFVILSGRNNLQNDQLTLRRSSKEDLWFHTKEIPGSHTVIVTEGTDAAQIPQQTLIQAAIIAAWHSKGRDSSKVPVDYTTIRNVKKPAGAKPGKVIYDCYNTLYVTPDQKLIEQLREP